MTQSSMLQVAPTLKGTCRVITTHHQFKTLLQSVKSVFLIDNMQNNQA